MNKSVPVIFSAWTNGPLVIARREDETATLLLFGLNGDTFGDNGAKLSSDMHPVNFAKSLGMNPRPASGKEEKTLRQLVDLTPVKVVFPRAPRPERVERAPESRMPKSSSKKPLTPEEETAKAAALAELKRFQEFAGTYKATSLSSNDKRVSDEARRVGQVNRCYGFLFQIKDRRNKTASVVGLTCGQFFPAVPDREEGMGAASRNKWAAQEITTAFNAFQKES